MCYTESMAKKTKLVLIDSHALIHRAYHALPPMSTRSGQPTNAVYGFTMMLLKVLSTLKPTHIVACFDMKGPTFRHEAYKEYKAQRKEADEELKVQFDVVRDIVRAFNIPIFEQSGYEADDIIGTIARQAKGINKIIVTGDMDTLQLVDEATRVFTLKRGITDTILYDEAQVREKYGFGPELVTDYKGLRGDPSDNIKGVAGIGEKTAKDLVVKYGRIEKIYQHLPDLPPRVRTLLQKQEKEAWQSRELATINCDAPVQFTLANASVTHYNHGQVVQLFEQLEFRSLLSRLPKIGGEPEMQPTLFGKLPTASFTEASASQGKTEKDQWHWPENYHLVQGEKEKKALRKLLLKQKLIAFDTETDGLNGRTSPIVGMSFAFHSSLPLLKGETKRGYSKLPPLIPLLKEGKISGSTTAYSPPSPGGEIQAYYVPVTQKSLIEWRDVLESEEIKKTGHNLKYDYEVLAQSGIELKGIVFDSMLASYLLNPGVRQHSLDTLAIQELGHQSIPITDLIGVGKEQIRMSQVPLEQIVPYACEDAELALRLYHQLAPRLQAEELTLVLQALEVPLIPILAAMEMAGVKIDTAVLARLQKRVARKLKQLLHQILILAGEDFNVNSTLQLRRILYEKLRLPTVGIARTQSGFSTAAAELEKLHGQHEIIALLEEYRELSKLLTTYLKPLPLMINETTGRIHTSFNQTITATGRLSSNEPNLQNIPARTELGQEIRSAFVAPAGKVLVKADYSQVELRLAAHLAQDQKMLAAFRAGEDIHQATAAQVFGVAPAVVTARQRRDAKTLNFGVLYGMGPQKFARSVGVSVAEAQSFIERYRDTYQGITNLVEQTIAQAEIHGFVTTMFGRKRFLPEIRSRAPAVRAAAQRAAFNFPIQGTAADILKKAMIALSQYIQRELPAAQMVLTVHDELVCEVPTARAEQLAKAMQRIMTGIVTLDVPLAVDVTIGKNWRDMETLK